MKLSPRFGAYGPNHRNARRAERSSRRFRPRLGLERMEERTLLSISSTVLLVPGPPEQVIMTGDSAADTLILGSSNGLLQHNTLTAPAGQGYADNLDFDSSTPNVSDHVDAGFSLVTINGGGNDRITIGTPSTPASTLKPTTPTSYATGFSVVGKPGGSDTLTIDDSTDTTPQQITISGSTVSFNNGPTITIANLSGLTILSGTGTTSLSVDFSKGNPIGTGTLTFTGGSGSNSLSLTGGSFTNESYVAASAGAGSITLDTTKIDFANLALITDTSTATNDVFQSSVAVANSVLVTNPATAAVVGATQELEITSSGSVATFTPVDLADKTNVIVNVGASNQTLAQSITFDEPTASNGLSSLTLNTALGNDAVNVQAAPQGAAVSVSSAGGDDAITVAANGMRFVSSFNVDGGAGNNTLNITAALQPETAMTASSVTILGSPPINFTNVEQVNVQDLADGTLVPMASNPSTFTSVTLSNIVLGQFSDDDPNSAPAGFQVVIDWGDGSQSLGSVQRINGAGSPYEVLGSHTYAKPGIYKENASVLDLRSSFTTTSGGVTFTNSDNGGFGLQVPGTVTLNVATYQTASFGITDLANQPITAALGAFAYSNPANPNPTFTASIDWGDNTPPTSGTLAGQPDGAYIVLGSHTYAQGNATGQPPYAVTVTITDNENHSTQFVTSATVAQSLTVTTTADSGAGSLRNVIEALNSSGQAGPITFNIPGTGVHTIDLLSPLPTIEVPVVIDGSSQPGFSGSPLIELSGSPIQASVYGAVYGLQLAGGTSVVRNLAINGFSSAGIVLKGQGGDVVVSDYIGTNPQGTAAVANGEGILVQGSSGNVIASNLISGNSYAGIELFNNATIKGTGYDPNGVAVHNAIQSNVIGTDLTVSRAIPNGLGILVDDAAFNLIGGPTSAAGNVISGNTSYGIQLLGEHATGNVVLANAIGTDRSHTRRLGNSIGVYSYAQVGNVIDQSKSATGNTIIFNGTNVLTRSLSQGPQVQRALIIPGASSTIAGFSIIYSAYVDSTRASQASNYVLNQVLGKGKLGAAIPLTATYIEQYRLTQLVLSSPIPMTGTYQLTIVGSAPGGVTDRVGIFLAGNPKAVRTPAGSNYVATYTNGVQVS